ncbi:Hypothetical protein KVN_LOCUS313 [uncultured virus]|nr:Hypothetical protein KVN_LOCUS313 [uncultured virus]
MNPINDQMNNNQYNPMNQVIGGTSIQDLQKKEQIELENLRRMQQQYQYNQLNNIKYDPNKNIPNIMQQMQNQYYGQKNLHSDNSHDFKQDIESLAKDISANMPHENFYGNENQEDNIKKQIKQNYMSMIPNVIKEPIILIIIYVILSQSFVKNGIGKYIKQINPDENGNISLIGIIIYGTILAVLFMFAKKILLK